MKPKNSPIPDFIELTIDSLSFNGGRGVGRYDGLVVFVPGTAPEEKVRARITLRKPRFWEAELVEILEPSPYRRTAPCPVAARCGGCSWQHVTYPAQVEQKKKILADSLRLVRKQGEFMMLPFLAAAEEFHYRNRIQIQVRDGLKGFFSKRSKDLVEVEECWISEPEINRRLRELQPEPGAQRIEIALDERGEALTMTGSRDPEAALFSQVNRQQNEVLKTRLQELPTFTPDWIMDLYSGAGNLTIPLAARFPDTPIFAVELSQASVARGRVKAMAHVEWLAEDVGKALKRRPRAQGAGLVILDPPRTGCDELVISELKRHTPKQIVYVSCNPATFARDALRLMEDGRYRLENVQGLDMFPQTEHVELIASFSSQ